MYSLFVSGDLDKNGDSLGRPAAAVDVNAACLLKRRVHNLLGLPPDQPLDSPPDCQVLRYRPGQRVQAHGDAADGLPLLIVLQGVAVIKVGGVVVERVGPGGCVGGGQFVLQVTCGGSLHCWPLRLPTIISQQKNPVDALDQSNVKIFLIDPCVPMKLILKLISHPLPLLPPQLLLCHTMTICTAKLGLDIV